MGHLARHAHFGMQLREARGIRVDFGRKELQRDRLSELEIVRAVDLAHAPFADSSDDAIARIEDRAGLEPSVIDIGRGARPSAAAGHRFRTRALSTPCIASAL